ncbi:MAG: Gfo/Idh/MocA family oxidoreductase [Chloroflexi bacterium]|nr:Gfo/Idh/MocA family oxidoreductase [Chloroflexota bacterium]
MTDQLGVLLLSCVRHQRDYAPYIAAHPRLKIVAVADEPGLPDWMRKANVDMAANYNVPYIEDVAAALARPGVQIASVCTEPTRHARLATQAALAGKHVLVDKPMCTTLEDGDRLIAAVKQAGVKCTYIHRLYSQSTQMARQAILDGKLGLPYALHVDFLSGGGLGSGAVEDFRLVVDSTLSGGGEMMNFLVYPVGYLRFLTGLEIVSVYAAAGTHFFEPHRQWGVEDLASVAFTLERGVVATVTVGRIPAVLPNVGEFTIRIHGSHGYLFVDEYRPRVDIYGERGLGVSARVANDPGAARTVGILDDFIAAIDTGREPLVGPRDGRAVTAAILAAYESSRTNQVVEVA